MSEYFNVNSKLLDTLAEAKLEACLVALEFISNCNGLKNELVPDFGHVFFLVDLLFVHAVAEVGFNQVVHLVDRLELQANVGLLFADFFEREHNGAERVDVFDWLVDLDTDLLDLVGQLLQKVLGLLVQLSREGFFPLVDVVLERVLHVVSFERKRANLMVCLNVFYIVDVAVKFLKFGLKVLELRIFLAEVLQLVLRFLFPQP